MKNNYADVEMAVAKLIASLTEIFKVGAVTRGDFSPMTQGFDRVCVLIPGAFASERVGGNVMDTTWGVSADIFQRYAQPEKAFADFNEMRSAVIDMIETHPSLHLTDVQVAGVYSTTVAGGDEPSFVTKEGTNVTTHIVQTLNIQVKQMIEYTGGEFA